MLRLTLIVMAVVLVAVSPASATLLFDDVSRANLSPSRPAESSPLAAITVSVPTSINQIGARMDLNSSGNLKFLIFDLTSHALLFGTGPTAYVDNGLTFKVSPVFSDFVLSPGNVYGIGAIADVAGLWSVGVPPLGTTPNFTQNNITADAHRNGNVKIFASPALDPDAVVMGIVQLYGGAVAQVPEPATLGLLAASLAMLTAASRRLRGRRP